MMPRAVRIAIGATLAAAMSGCSLAPHYVRGEAPVPPSWPVGDAYLRQSEAALPQISYTTIFRDPRLQALVTQALANNRDVRVAAANVAAARAQVRVIRANQFPEITATADGTYNRVGGNSANAATSGKFASYQLQGGISAFELDLFGRLASATAAQRERALGTEAAARTVRLSLVADIANAWAAYAADKDLLEIARATTVSASRSVEITRLRLNGGVAPRTDLSQALQVLSTAQGDVAEQTALVAQDGNVMRLLVGADFDPALLPNGLSEVLSSIDTLPPGTSSQVLLRRPDVVEAEYTLRAANADIGVARAELFPTISLTAVLGFGSRSLSSLFSSGSYRYTAGGNGSYSIFNAGGRRANVRVTEAQRDSALATYEQTIQTAFREVADALSVQGTIGTRLRAANTNTTAAADVARLTEARYQFGVDNYLAVLDSQRSLYTARRTEVAERLTAAQNRVTLYRVLGGDQGSDVAP